MCCDQPTTKKKEAPEMRMDSRKVLSSSMPASYSYDCHLHDDPNAMFNDLNFDALDSLMSDEIINRQEDKCVKQFEPEAITSINGQSYPIDESIDSVDQLIESNMTRTSTMRFGDFPSGRLGNLTVNPIPVGSSRACPDYARCFNASGFTPDNEGKADRSGAYEGPFTPLSPFKTVGGADQADTEVQHEEIQNLVTTSNITTSSPTFPKLLLRTNTAQGQDNAEKLPIPVSFPNQGERQQRFRDYQEENWNIMFKVLCDFHKTYGHSLVPHTFDPNPRLAQWVKRQRRQYKLNKEGKPSSMTQERILKLEQVGFIWDSHELVWESRFKELREYKENYGNCNVPSSYILSHQLSIWVKRQRRQYKLFWAGERSSMTFERIAKLSDLGFSWQIRRSSSKTRDD